MKFCDEVDKYLILKLFLDKYKDTPYTLKAGLQIAGSEVREMIRKDEKRLLKFCFLHWSTPYHGTLKGWRKNSPIYILNHGHLIGGLYVCDGNEFDDDKRWGQLHYFFVDPQFRGNGYHRILFGEGVHKARSWGLEGVYINTDRYGLPEVYERWGAMFWKDIPKASLYSKHQNIRSHNWLVYRIHDEGLIKVLRRYASGVLVDIGCGEKPYAVYTKELVSKHIGVDHTNTKHDRTNTDILASAYNTTLPDSSADTVLCTAVLEHLERPQEAISEMHRILKPGGYVILSAPMIWHLHEEPRDFFRYTKYGLQYMFVESGFEIVEINPLSGFIVTFTLELTYFLNYFKRSVFRCLIAGIQWSLQQMAYRLNKYDKTFQFTWLYMLVARKPSKID